MIQDSTAWMLEGLTPRLKRLGNLEAQARSQADSRRKKDQQLQAQQLRLQLLREGADPLAVACYLQVTGLASEREWRAAVHQWMIEFPRLGGQGEEALERALSTPLDERALAVLAPGAAAIQLAFALNQPYVSGGRHPLGGLHVSLNRDPVLGVPLIQPTQLVGALRSCLLQLGLEREAPAAVRLFGRTQGDEEEAQRGRLQAFPIFFFQRALEVREPHSRASGIAATALFVECVPPGTRGELRLLYRGASDAQLVSERVWRSQVAEDLQLLCSGAAWLLRYHGLGRWTSAGFGTASLLEGSLLLRPGPSASAVVARTFAGFDGFEASSREVIALLEGGV